MATLRVREVFPTVQGEGSATGAPAVFLRFTGCNLWSGLDKHRSRGKGSCALWCDTDFATGDRVDPEELAHTVLGHMEGWSHPLVVITGGEPLLQLRRPPGEALVRHLLDLGVTIHLETNGTLVADCVDDLHHVTVSPKALAGQDHLCDTHAAPLDQTLDHVKLRRGTDLKVVHPQWTRANLEAMGGWEFDHCYIQPMDGAVGTTPALQRDHLEETVAMARTLGWRVSAQVHKLMGWE